MSYGELRSRKLFTEGRYQEAVATATSEIEAQPDEPEAYFNRGQALAALDRFAEAVEDYHRALRMDASGSALDPEAVDDELFFALRSESTRLAERDRVAAAALLRRYAALVPEGRHLEDVGKWVDKINGIETVWVRDTA